VPIRLAGNLLSLRQQRLDLAEVQQRVPAFLLLHDVLGGVDGAAGVWGVVVGGMSGIADALAGAARERGVTIRTSVRVAAIELGAGGAVDGVRLESGEVVRASVVVSNALGTLTSTSAQLSANPAGSGSCRNAHAIATVTTGCRFVSTATVRGFQYSSPQNQIT